MVIVDIIGLKEGDYHTVVYNPVEEVVVPEKVVDNYYQEEVEEDCS